MNSKVIHIDSGMIRANVLSGTDRPVMCVTEPSGAVRHGNEILIGERTRVRFDRTGHPSHGVKAWIETTEKVEIIP